jgi:uncharacterized protein
VASGLTVAVGCPGSSAIYKFWRAVDAGDVGEVERLVGQDPGLLEAKDGDGMTPLVCASRAGHMEVLRLLLNSGAAINEGNGKGDTALTFACRRDNIPLVKLLVDRGVDTTISGVFGTPLMTASSKGHSEVVRFLLGLPIVKTAIDQTNVVGATALWMACLCGRGACVTELLETCLPQSPRQMAPPPRPSQSKPSMGLRESMVQPPRAAGSA